MIVVMPRQAVCNEEGSFRSPVTSSAPKSFSCAIRSGFDEPRISALVAWPREVSCRQISLPNIPVAPTTRFMTHLAFAVYRGAIIALNGSGSPRDQTAADPSQLINHGTP